MAWDRLKIGFLAWLERLAAVPGVIDRRDDPEVPIGVADNPVLWTRPVHEEGYHALLHDDHVRFLQNVSVCAVCHRGDPGDCTPRASADKAPTGGPVALDITAAVEWKKASPGVDSGTRPAYSGGQAVAKQDVVDPGCGRFVRCS